MENVQQSLRRAEALRQSLPGIEVRKDRYSIMARRIYNLQVFLLLSLVGTVIVSSLLVWRWSRLEVRVYQVDRFGDIRLLGPGEEIPVDGDVVVEAVLKDWIRWTRTVTKDRDLQAELILRSQVATRGEARERVQSDLESRNPYLISESETVQVEIEWVNRQPASESAWDVGWIERRKTRYGETEESWRAWITVAHREPQTQDELLFNPLGIVLETYEPILRSETNSLGRER